MRSGSGERITQGQIPGGGISLPTTRRIGNCEGIYTSSAKKLLFYFLSDGKLLKSFEGWEEKYLMQLDA